jgi:deoxyribodipyrimidine photo-lyase
MATAIHWFRRDLRILDNTALCQAARVADVVVPAYVLSTWQGDHAWTGPKRQQFLCGCLESLDQNLRTLEGRLIVRSGPPLEALRALVEETGATAIFFNRDPDPHGKEVEQDLQRACESWGVECHGWHDVTLHRPDEVLTQGGDPYRVFTPYSRNWDSQEKPLPLPKPGALHTPPRLRSEDLPTVGHWGLETPAADLLPAGERAALDRLKQAVAERLPDYAEQRDVPSTEGTSRLSQDLRFGLLSPRTVHRRIEEARKQTRSGSTREGLDTFKNELAWREFYMAILEHFPGVLEKEFNCDWQGLPWDEPGPTFEAWKEGRTGFPLVDAGMRQLLHTGFMHNRLRMITAMFLTKDLHLDWRLGESFFMQHLIDGEIAANNGGWQWSAGTGADAAPYFRIQNPWSQSKRHDPEGTYIRRWVPELAKVSADKLHEAPRDGRPIADDYPLPCVDHKSERERTLAIFKKHKEQARR